MNKTVKTIISILILAGIAGIAGFMFMESNSVKVKQINVVGAGTEYKAEDVLMIEGGTLEPDQIISYSKVGIVQARLNVKASHMTISKAVTIEVSDITPPTITFQHQESTVHPGGAMSTWWYTVSDDVSSNVTVRTEGGVDATKAGTYSLTVIATDEAGNVARETGIFVVEPDTSSSSKRACKECGKVPSDGLSGGGYCNSCARKISWGDSTDVDVWWGY